MKRANLGRLSKSVATVAASATLAAMVLSLNLQAAAAESEGVPVANSADEIQPLLIGAEVPAVTVHRPDGQAVNLKEAVQEQPSVLIFYRGGW